MSARDPYAAFRIKPEEDVGIKIMLHRGGGGGMGQDGSVSFVCDTVSTEHYGIGRALTQGEEESLDAAVKSIVRVLQQIRAAEPLSNG